MTDNQEKIMSALMMVRQIEESLIRGLASRVMRAGTIQDTKAKLGWVIERLDGVE